MKLPGPDHPITITADGKHVHVLFEGHLIADSAGALSLKEAGYKPVYYFPREDVAMEYLGRTAHRTYCPYKGEASYFSLVRDGQIVENAVWSYEDPYPAVDVIGGYVAFYPHLVEVREVDDGPHAPVADVVEHTDSGAGASQLDHWPPNVSEPPPEPPASRVPFSGTGSI